MADWATAMPFCGDCKSLVYPKDGKLECRKCGWTSKGPAKKQVVTAQAKGRDRLVLEGHSDPRQQHEADCPKCGHRRAYFHLMQTRRSDEPPTEINECMECGHSWREY